ncbi:putative UDP-glucosyltransferase [Hordeum vulgare]|nr:putative UDP-glucosyltransferase [Hordeum vulgare]
MAAPHPHVMVLPFPAQGHVMPLMELSHRLVGHGLEVDFVNTDYNHDRVLKAMQGAERGAAGPDGVNMVSIPDGMGPDGDRTDVATLGSGLPAAMLGPLEEMVRSKRIKWVIADVVMCWATELAARTSVRVALFSTCSAATIALRLHLSKLIDDDVLDECGKRKPKQIEHSLCILASTCVKYCSHREEERDDPAEPQDAASRGSRDTMGLREQLAGQTQGDNSDLAQDQPDDTAGCHRHLQHIRGDRVGGITSRPQRAARRTPGSAGVVEVCRPTLARGTGLPPLARRAGPRLRRLRGLRELHHLRRGAVPGARRRAGAHRPALSLGGPAEHHHRNRRRLARRLQAPRGGQRSSRGLGATAARPLAPLRRLLRVALRVELHHGRAAARRAVPVLAILRRPVLQPELHLQRVGHRRQDPRRRERGRHQGGDQEQSRAAAG